MTAETNDAFDVIVTRADLRKAATLLGRSEIRHLVTSYYQVQEFRTAAGNMVHSQRKDGRPYGLVQWLANEQRSIEDSIKAALGAYAKNDQTGAWALSQHGIGPVISAGLLAHIDVEKAPTAGHIWSFAGLNPSQKWEKGQKRPWNAELKTLCWKLGDSFVKSSNSPKSFYGPIYRARKAQEIEKNDAGDFAELAAKTLAERTIKDKATKDIYEAGKLPLGRLDLRARRIAVKLFLSHFHDVLTYYELGRRAPQPYAFEHLGHTHRIDCPGAPWA